MNTIISLNVTGFLESVIYYTRIKADSGPSEGPTNLPSFTSFLFNYFVMCIHK